VDVTCFDRKNLRNSIEFSVKRGHETLADAELFVLTHETTLPSVGIIGFQINEGSFLYMRGGLESVSLVEHIGVSTTFSYVLVGGRISNVIPR